ncbi:MAG: MFS transporter [Caldilineaceae bacterium]|nr:MFS transporter [Caldilineaceae bacterium]
MKTNRLSAISLGHFAIDVLNSSVAIILTVFTRELALGYSKIGLGVMIYTLAASLSQPFFGLLADRWRGRWLAAFGLLWTMSFYAIAAFADSYTLLLTLLTIGALGSGAFHPTGIVNAGDAGGSRPTTATSVFFLLGQTGLSVGPFAAGLVLDQMGMHGLPYIALATLPAFFYMLWALRTPTQDHDDVAPAAATGSRSRGAAVTIVVLFLLLVILRSSTLQSYIALLPPYFADQGFTSSQYGFMISIFTLAGALGTFSGGFLGDRFDRRHVIAVTLILSVPFSFLLLRSSGWGYYITAALSGALLNVPHSILLIMGQELLPKRKGMIGGVVLGLMFAAGAASAWLAGLAADRIGLMSVLTLLAFVPLLAAALVYTMPKARPRLLRTPADAAAVAAD